MKYLKLFEEVTLTLGELDKDQKGGGKRGDTLVKKLRENPATLNIKGKGEKEIIAVKVEDPNDPKHKVIVDPAVAADQMTDDNGSYTRDKAEKVFTKYPSYRNYDKSLIIDGDEVELNKVVKTAEFGSVGPGVLTRKYEAIQCLFIAYKLRYPGELLDKDRVIDFWEKYVNKDDEVFKKIGIHLDSSFVLTREIIDSLSSNKDWLNTFIKVPELIMNFKGIFPRVANAKKYLVFLESNKDINSPVVNIVKKYNELKKVAGSSVNFSKFCPADVYIVVGRHLDTINNEIKKQTSIDGLVKLLNTYFDSNDLIPVSLKKLNSGDKVIINNEQVKKLPTFTISKFIITDNPLKGIASKLEVSSVWASEKPVEGEKPEESSRSIIFDSSDTSKARNIDGDISGRSSRHGKVSFNSMHTFMSKNGFIERYDLTLDTYSKLSTKDDNELREMILLAHDDLLNLVPNLIEIVSTRYKNGSINKTYSDLEEGSSVNNIKNRLISKLQSLQLLVALAIIQSEEPTDANIVITGIMRYALSIQTDLFKSTPRYLRII